MSNEEQAFTRWLEQRGREKSAQNCADEFQDPLWQQRCHTAQQLQHLAQMAQPLPVPDWQREQTFVRTNSSWWQWSGMSLLSMSMSLCAVFLLLFNVQVTVADGSVRLSFGQPAMSEQQLATLVNERVAEQMQQFKTDQQLMLANYASDIANTQQSNNLKLATYILSESRRERKEDFSDFISYSNEQRREENRLQNIKFRQLETQLSAQQYHKGRVEQQLQPTTWQLEE